MRHKSRRLWIASGFAFAWAIHQYLIAPFLNLNVETWLQEHDGHRVFVDGPPAGVMEAVQGILGEDVLPSLAYVLGDFGLGFVIGALLFSLPDLPVFASRIRRRREARAGRPDPTRISNGSMEQDQLRAHLQQRTETIAGWRTMLAETSSAVRERGADIRTVLLGSPEYLSLEPRLELSVRNFVRTGYLGYERTAVVPSEEEAGMSYEDRVLYHLGKEISRIECEWTAAGG